ncbi:MAG: exosortase-associated EpsI family protein [Phycisphaerales bacterium]
MFNKFAKILIVLLLVGLFFERRARTVLVDAGPFHERVAAAIERVPATFGEWESTEIPVPTEAQELLRPTATLAREYTNTRTGASARLVVVHCERIRDLSGHYPPNCYPAHGWVETTPGEGVLVPTPAGTLPMVRYTYLQDTFGSRSEMVVYDFFMLPQRGAVASMEAVRDASGDLTLRNFGATQVQVLLTRTRPRAEEEKDVSMMIGLITDVIRTIKANPGTPENLQGSAEHEG